VNAVGRIFVSYRRADDPFGAGLVAAVLRDRFGDDGVFLDTWVLNRRGNPENGLCRGLDGSAVVLALIGRRWEERLGARDPGATAAERDWVAWELREAALRGLPVVPVFLRRSRLLGEDVPDELHHVLDGQGVSVRQGSLHDDVERLVTALAEINGTPAARPATLPIDDDSHTVSVAVDAMLRHVVSVPQQRVGNRQLLVATCATVLGRQDWLRHVSAGASPGRPAGSGIVVATEGAVTVANLDERFVVVDRPSVTLGRGPDDLESIDVRRRKRLLVRPVADLRLNRRNGTYLDIQGLFAGAADDLIDNLPAAVRPDR
jgi:TIR domain